MTARPLLQGDPRLREFIDRAVVPALLARFLRQHAIESDRPAPLGQPTRVECSPSA